MNPQLNTFKADKSDFLLPVGLFGNSIRLCIGARDIS